MEIFGISIRLVVYILIVIIIGIFVGWRSGNIFEKIGHDVGSRSGTVLGGLIIFFGIGSINLFPEYFGFTFPSWFLSITDFLHPPFDTLYDLFWAGKTDSVISGFEVKRLCFASFVFFVPIGILFYGNWKLCIFFCLIAAGILLRFAWAVEITPLPGEIIPTGYDSVSSDGKPILDTFDKIAKVVTKYGVAIFITIAVLFFLGWRVTKMTTEDLKKETFFIWWVFLVGVAIMFIGYLATKSYLNGGHPIRNFFVVAGIIGALLLVLYKPSENEAEEKEED